MLRRVLASLLAAGSLCAGPAHAQVTDSLIDATGTVRLEHRCHWPAAWRAGYVPVGFEFRNDRKEDLVLRLEVFLAGDAKTRMSGTVEVPAGGTRSVSWNVLVHDFAENDAIWFRVLDGDRELFNGHAQERDTDLDAFPVLVVADPGARAWRSFPGEDLDFDRLRPKRDDPPQEWVTWRHSSSGSRSAEVTSAVIGAADLPTTWQSYTSLSLVVLDLEGAELDTPRAEALLDWVRLGGALFLHGDPALAEPFLERHGVALGSAIGAADPRRPDLNRIHRLEFGHLVLPGGDLPPSAMADRIDSFEENTRAPAGPFHASLERTRLLLPGLDSLPTGVLGGMLVLFALVMGPAQMRFLKRRGAGPFSMLVSTPLLGVGFSIVVIGVSLAARGLGNYETVASVTWLDQESHQASTIAARSVYSGSVFRPALRYDARTAVLPAMSTTRDPEFRVDVDEGGSLGGDWLLTRSVQRDTLARRSTWRGRLSFERDGARLHVTNGLDAGVRDLYYHDAQGVWHHLADPLPAGASATMNQTETPGFELAQAALVWEGDAGISLAEFSRGELHPQFPAAAEVPRLHYIALLEESPFLDDGGIEREELLGRHILVGRLEGRR